ncbi:hypothetical protein B0H66DRAFT_485655 [Apodospora peruviana]|uniref:Kinesin light chain n=1 Tax=Apodospora peruviana TaxID=516989 RepID=A0AAE0HSZ5_9PEZI|nr:hypothetical protein B0H66DRAFT_485655 [Apodospora peruviana]
MESSEEDSSDTNQLILLQGFFEEMRQTHGEDHPDTLATMRALAFALGKTEDYEEHKSFFYRLLESQKRASDDQSRMHKILANLAHALGQQGKSREETQILKGLLAWEIAILGPDHDDVYATMARAARLQIDKENMPQAALLYRTMWDWKKRVVGEDHVDTVSILALLEAMLWHSHGRDQAVRLSQTVFDVRKRVLGDMHHDTVRARETLNRDRNRAPRCGGACFPIRPR